MKKLNWKKCSLSVGSVFALFHLIGTLLFQAGLAKQILNLHFLDMDLILLPFSVWVWLLGIALAFIVGAVTGLIFSSIWNWMEE